MQKRNNTISFIKTSIVKQTTLVLVTVVKVCVRVVLNKTGSIKQKLNLNALYLYL